MDWSRHATPNKLFTCHVAELIANIGKPYSKIHIRVEATTRSIGHSLLCWKHRMLIEGPAAYQCIALARPNVAGRRAGCVVTIQ